MGNGKWEMGGMQGIGMKGKEKDAGQVAGPFPGPTPRVPLVSLSPLLLLPYGQPYGTTLFISCGTFTCPIVPASVPNQISRVERLNVM